MSPTGLLSRLFATFLALLPHQLLSRLLATLVEWQYPPWKNSLIRLFCRLYRVNLAEALPADVAAYPTFGDFFARRIDLSHRPAPTQPGRLLCPADGTISQFGTIKSGRLLQAKGKWFTVAALLDDAGAAQAYEGGSFCTIYLSPRDYHRVHTPLAGNLQHLVHLPGRLFSVQEATANTVPDLYTRNERAVFHFGSPRGPFVVAMVGAIFVSGITTPWGGLINPHGQRGHRWEQRFTGSERRTLAAGEELGAFRMGSTAIVLLPRGMTWASDLTPGAPVQVRAGLGELL